MTATKPEPREKTVDDALRGLLGEPAYNGYISTGPSENEKRILLQSIKDKAVERMYDPTNPHVGTGRLWSSNV